MSTYMIYYKNGVKMMRPVLTREEYLELRNGGFQVENVARIRKGDEALKASLYRIGIRAWQRRSDDTGNQRAAYFPKRQN